MTEQEMQDLRIKQGEINLKMGRVAEYINEATVAGRDDLIRALGAKRLKLNDEHKMIGIRIVKEYKMKIIEAFLEEPI